MSRRAWPRRRNRQTRAADASRVVGGEGGIRTLGTGYPVRQISNLVPSTTRPPLRSIKSSTYAVFALEATSRTGRTPSLRPVATAVKRIALRTAHRALKIERSFANGRTVLSDWLAILIAD